MRIEKQVDVAAPPAEVFATYADVERWPEWTASVDTVERLDSGPLAVGSRARVKQPRLPKQVWTVTALEAGRTFSWESKGLGVTSTGIHLVEPHGDGSRVTAAIEMTGPLAGVAMRTARALIESYLAMEAMGIKRRCEQTTGG